MSGTINSAPASSSTLANPLLQQIEAALESKLSGQLRQDYDKIVVAGLHIALANGPNSYLAKLHASQDPIGDCAKGSAQLVMIMSKQSKGQMPPGAMFPAAMTLCLHGLDFIGRTGEVQIAEPEVDRCTSMCANMFLHLNGITPKMLQTATQKIHGIMSDPTSMAKINLKSGVTRDPNAALPTPLPDEPMGATNGAT